MRPSPALSFTAIVAVAVLVLAPALPAAAEHTDPLALPPITERPGEGGEGFGEGTWDHVENFPPNPGTDLEFFDKSGVTYGSFGTLGQSQGQAIGYVGQRILRLIDDAGEINPTVVADHGSADCNYSTNAGTGALGLQHDVQVTPKEDPELLIDTTDAAGRCHDAPAGGLELIDVSGLGTEGFAPRELHLTRHDGTSHTVTVDATRPWIVYNNNAEFANQPWIELLDIRTCLGGTDRSLEERRTACRPEAYRIPFQDAWSSQLLPDDTLRQPASCHDITVAPGRVYCAALNATLIFDVSDLTDEQGDVRGAPLPAVRDIAGTLTEALVTDFRLDPTGATTPAAAYEALGRPQAEGWTFLGSVNHPGRNCGGPDAPTNCNSNNVIPSDEGVAVSHEADPSPDGRFVAVTDERGGGVVPGGASCSSGIDNPFGNGGVHFFDISDPAAITYALEPDGTNAIFIIDPTRTISSPSFCTAHVMEFVPGQQRFIISWYSQGVRIVDYTVDAAGAVTFEEIASYILPGDQQWSSEPFKIVDNEDGSQTYHIMANDISRGIDYLTWTGPPGPIAVPIDPADPDPPVDPPTTDATIVRVAGAGREETAVEVAQTAYPEGATTVVLARADVYADALAGAPLAKQEQAPLLLTPSSELSDATAAEIERLGAERVVILGGHAAVSPGIEAGLVAQGLDVDRVAGENRFETAALVAQELGATADDIYLTEGENTDPARGWPDALSVAPSAAFLDRPILLVNRDRLPQETIDALERLNPELVTIVGGIAAVGEQVEAEVQSLAIDTRRIAGANRYATSVAVYEEGLAAGMDAAELWLATGRNFPDALAAGPSVGALGDSFLLVDGTGLAGSTDSRDAIASRADQIALVHLLGGEAAISPAVHDEVSALLDPPAKPKRTDAAALVLALMVLPGAAIVGRRRRPAGEQG